MLPVKTGLMIALCAAALLPCQVGCKSRTERAQERVETETWSFRNRLMAMPQLIDDTVRNMNTATSGQNPNRESDFRRFQKSVAEMNDAARLVGNKYQEALSDSNAFYKEWSNDARQLSGEERLALEQKIQRRLATRADAIAYFDAARTSFLKFTNSLNSIERSLAADRGETNVRAQGPMVERAMVDANDAKIYAERLDEVISTGMPRQ